MVFTVVRLFMVFPPAVLSAGFVMLVIILNGYAGFRFNDLTRQPLRGLRRRCTRVIIVEIPSLNRVSPINHLSIPLLIQRTGDRRFVPVLFPDICGSEFEDRSLRCRFNVVVVRVRFPSATVV